ncbi:hypothetical protein SPFM9_00207 [Salmonella phage SPFM9]|nr:hypothetical protein SPFM9_00207 [Salmonella phage SPFM9]
MDGFRLDQLPKDMVQPPIDVIRVRTSFEEWTKLRMNVYPGIRVKVEQDVVITDKPIPVAPVIKEMAIPQRITNIIYPLTDVQRVSRSSFMTDVTDPVIPILDDILAEAADTMTKLSSYTVHFAARMGSDTYNLETRASVSQAEIQRAMVRLELVSAETWQDIATDALNVATDLDLPYRDYDEFFKTFGFDYLADRAAGTMLFTYHYRDYKCISEIMVQKRRRYRYSYNRHKTDTHHEVIGNLMSADELYDEMEQHLPSSWPGRFNALINYYKIPVWNVFGVLIKRWVGFDEELLALFLYASFKGYSGVALDNIYHEILNPTNGDTLKLTSKWEFMHGLFNEWMHIVARGQYPNLPTKLVEVTAIDPEAIERPVHEPDYQEDLDRRLSLTQYLDIVSTTDIIQKEINLAYNNPLPIGYQSSLNYTERDSGRDGYKVAQQIHDPTTGSDDDLTEEIFTWMIDTLLTGWGMPAVLKQKFTLYRNIRYWERNSGKYVTEFLASHQELHEFMPYLTPGLIMYIRKRLQFTTETHSYWKVHNDCFVLAFYMQQYPVWLITHIENFIRAAHVRFMADGVDDCSILYYDPALVEPQETSDYAVYIRGTFNPIDIAYAIRTSNVYRSNPEYIDDLIAEYPSLDTQEQIELTTQNLSRHKKRYYLHLAGKRHAIDKPIYITQMNLAITKNGGFVSENRETWRDQAIQLAKSLIVKSESIAQRPLIY